MSRLCIDCLSAGWTLIRMPGRSHRGPLPDADERLKQLDAELRRHVSVLAEEIGERNVQRRPRELSQAADYVSAQFASFGYAPGRQEYVVDGVTCTNLEVELPGTSRAEEIVIVGAHYDSVPGSPAANDNGSGIAAVLSLARAFAGSQTDRTLRFVAFVNEEKPYGHTQQMGSWRYARRCRARGERVSAMLSLETIGYYSDEPGSQTYPTPLSWLYPSTGNFIAFVGHAHYGSLVRKVVKAFRSSEPFPSQGGALPAAFSDIGRSDHWPFWQEGYPALMVTDTANFRYPHYHQAEDTVDKLDLERTARVVRGLEAVVRALTAVR